MGKINITDDKELMESLRVAQQKHDKLSQDYECRYHYMCKCTGARLMMLESTVSLLKDALQLIEEDEIADVQSFVKLITENLSNPIALLDGMKTLMKAKKMLQKEEK